MPTLSVIPQADPGRSYRAQAAEIDAAIGRVLTLGRFILGEEGEAFEHELAAFLGVRYAVGVGSGTDAIALALRAAGIAPGDEVITVSHTAVATVAAIEMIGALPVLVDVEPRTMTIDPAAIEGMVGPKTRAIVAVHLYGHPAATPQIVEIGRRRHLAVIEDGAQAHGAELDGRRVGGLGTACAFRFYPTKNLGAFGDGGAVTTDDASLADEVRKLRQYGWNRAREAQRPGTNSRLDEIQAAVLRVKLRALAEAIERRRAIAARYTEAWSGSGVELPSEAPGARHAFHLYVLRAPDRGDLAAALARRGIGTAVHYPVPVHLQPAYRGRVRCASLSVSERIARQVVSVPLYPELTESEVDAVIEALLAAVRR